MAEFESTNIFNSLLLLLEEFILNHIDCYIVYSHQRALEVLEAMYPPENSGITPVEAKPIIHIDIDKDTNISGRYIINDYEKGKFKEFVGAMFVMVEQRYVEQQTIVDATYILNEIIGTLSYVAEKFIGELKSKKINNFRLYKGKSSQTKNDSYTIHVMDVSFGVEALLKWS